VDTATLDASVTVAVHAAAGELQREVAEVGPQDVSEADLRRAARAGLQSQLGPVVRAECPAPKVSAWTGRLGGIDIGVFQGGTMLAGIEVKWCRQRDKIAEAIWDALKLMPLTIDDGELRGAYLLYAAPLSAWTLPAGLPVELFESGEHRVADLLKTHDKSWRWLLTGNKSARPKELRSAFTTELVAQLPILNPHGEVWELRCSRVQATAALVLFFDDGLVSLDQPAFGPPAPASRFIDGPDDSQVDHATTPENIALLKDIQAQLSEAGEADENP
jgi:hypothetical protein